MNCSIYMKIIQLRFVFHIWSRVPSINVSPNEIRQFFSSKFYTLRHYQPLFNLIA